MDVSKAIEILSDSANAGMTTFNQDFKLAQLLSIQALIRHRDAASRTFAGMLEPLPGETEVKHA